MLTFLAPAVLAQGGWREGEMEVRVQIHSPGEARLLGELHLNGDIYGPSGFALMYVIPSELNRIRSAGLSYTIEKRDLNVYFQGFWSRQAEAYHNYSQIISLMDSLAGAYPGICRKIVTGTTPQGRELSYLEISGNVDADENEPQVLFDGGIHGDEIIAPENMIRFARYLCTGYGSDPAVTLMVDTRRIVIDPMVNPDGRANVSRYNSNGVDCNRDHGYMWNGEGNSPSAESQPETRALRNLMYGHRFTVHVTYHSGEQVVLYPWCYRSAHAPDFAALYQLATIYSATSGYTNLPSRQSYADYPTNGETIDYSYGALGTDALTVEISTNKQPPANQIPYYFSVNLPAMMAMLQKAGCGLRGTVTDSLSGAPVQAEVFVNSYFPVFTDSLTGSYFKFLPEGTYTVKVMANGFLSKEFSGVTVAANDSTVLDVRLVPAPGHYATRLAAVVIPGNNPQDLAYTPGLAGAPDSLYYSLGKGGWVIADMQSAVTDFDGPDVTVFEGDDTPEGFTCYASLSMDGPWVNLGNGSGTTAFDLAGSGLDSARFIRIVDDNDGIQLGNHAGFDLDAIDAVMLWSGSGSDTDAAPPGILLFPNPTMDLLHIRTGPISGEVTVTLYTLSGQEVLSVRTRPGNLSFPLGGYDAGVYFVSLSWDSGAWHGLFVKE
jgi:hypothetical protein